MLRKYDDGKERQNIKKITQKTMFNIWTDLFFIQNIRRYKYVEDPVSFYILWKFIEFNFNKITPQIINAQGMGSWPNIFSVLSGTKVDFGHYSRCFLKLIIQLSTILIDFLYSYSNLCL